MLLAFLVGFAAGSGLALVALAAAVHVGRAYEIERRREEIERPGAC